MKKIMVEFDFALAHGGNGTICEKYFEFEDTITKEEIRQTLQQHWEEWIHNFYDGGWRISRYLT